MKPLVAALTLAFVLMLVPVAAARAATVTALALPAGFTVKPEGEQRLISIAPDHTVAAFTEAGGALNR